MTKKNLFWYGLTYYMSIFAARGCLEKSWHMAKPFDNKEYHVVSRNYGGSTTYCQCPCRRISHDRGYCYDCGHYRDLQPWVVIRSGALLKSH
jgi:hypothetical protein